MTPGETVTVTYMAIVPEGTTNLTIVSSVSTTSVWKFRILSAHVVAVNGPITTQFLAPGSGGAKRATAILGLTLGQAVLGIVTLLLVVPLWAGLAHQALGFLVLAMGVVHVTRTEGAVRG